MVYLDRGEKFFPSDIETHVLNTHPTTNFTAIKDAPDPLVLSNLDMLNPLGGKRVHLTSTYTLFNLPGYLYGERPDSTTLQTHNAKTSAIIVVDKGDDIVDAFYIYFYTFNEGPSAFGHRVGNHLGDWYVPSLAQLLSASH